MAVLLTSDTTTPGNGVYDGGYIAAAAFTALILGGYALLAARLSRVPVRSAYALVRPVPGWWRIAAAGFVAILVVNLALDPFLHADKAQGITPDRMPRGSEWVTLAVAVVILGVVVPAAEELMFRGLAFAALGRFAVVGSAALFALAHGIPELLPGVFVAGLALAEVRRRTRSLFSGMTVHAVLNITSILIAVLTA
jgi:membrane protease YdiL (CAAX protease family)